MEFLTEIRPEKLALTLLGILLFIAASALLLYFATRLVIHTAVTQADATRQQLQRQADLPAIPNPKPHPASLPKPDTIKATPLVLASRSPEPSTIATPTPKRKTSRDALEYFKAMPDPNRPFPPPPLADAWRKLEEPATIVRNQDAKQQ